jgi:hypothetical protein
LLKYQPEMKPFKNRGWEHYEKMQAIMFSTAARGSHIYCPAQALQVTAGAIDTADVADGMGSSSLIALPAVAAAFTNIAAAPSAYVAAPSAKAVDAQASIITPTAPDISGVHAAPMDIDRLPPLFASTSSTNSNKRSHSIMSDERSASTPITTPSVVLNVVPKKQQRSSRASLMSRDSQSNAPSRDSQGNMRPPTSRAVKVTPAVAMVAMQSQIGRLMDVFEKSMATPEDGTAHQRSLALARLQEQDDYLSLSEKVKLISIFQRDISAVQTYLDLLDDALCRAWLRSILD